MIRPYHTALATQISTLMISTSMDLGRAAGLAELSQTAFIPPSDRNEVIDAFAELKERVAKASLKKPQKEHVLDAITHAITMIKAQPQVMTQPNGAGMHTASPSMERRATG